MNWSKRAVVPVCLLLTGCSLIVSSVDDYTFYEGDGGMDAGLADAGATDAGVEGDDAGSGIDSGRMDAGVEDDSGTLDGGSDVDAGECASDSNCTAPAVCDEPSARCVECTVDSEMETCGFSATCDPATFTCGGAAPGSVRDCEPCVASSECDSGPMLEARCVDVPFGPSAMPAGSFCVTTRASLNAAFGGTECPPSVPHEVMAPIREGGSDTFCLAASPLLTTCSAILDFGNRETCSGDGECGIMSVDDGRCRMNRCTVPCEDETDCLDLPCTGGVCEPAPT